DGTVAINFWSLTASVMIFGGLTGFHVPKLAVTLWGWVLLGGCCSLAMRFCYIFGYRAGEASAVEVGSFALLLWAALIGLIFFGELPPLSFWAGAIVMFAGIALVMIEPAPQ